MMQHSVYYLYLQSALIPLSFLQLKVAKDRKKGDKIVNDRSVISKRKHKQVSNIKT